MITLQRTTSDNPDFLGLVKHLDADLAVRDGELHGFYQQYNSVEAVRHVVVAYRDGTPVGCGALREYTPDTMEIKRMYTPPERRGEGIASQVLRELERWAAELSYKKCVLETGAGQPEAIRLYTRNGYIRIPNYGQYAGVEYSLCFEKEL